MVYRGLDLLAGFDGESEKKLQNRSEAIRDLIRDQMVSEEVDKNEMFVNP